LVYNHIGTGDIGTETFFRRYFNSGAIVTQPTNQLQVERLCKRNRLEPQSISQYLQKTKGNQVRPEVFEQLKHHFTYLMWSTPPDLKRNYISKKCPH